MIGSYTNIYIACQLDEIFCNNIYTIVFYEHTYLRVLIFEYLRY